MKKQYLMGNEAIALAAINSGVRVICGYPGTPSTEILESAAKLKNSNTVHVEWSVNEKAAIEVAAGASYAGCRSLVTMKQVGLNVASDPAMSLAYVGVEGGMVIAVADDPGPISSQTEQDTRLFAKFSKIPILDPSSVQEAYDMTKYAFELSDKYKVPIILRPTTRICHAYASIDVDEQGILNEPKGFIKDTMRWVIFPRTSYLNHIKLEQRYFVLSKEFSENGLNNISEVQLPKKYASRFDGICASGISYAYLMEALTVMNEEIDDDKIPVKIFKVASAYPFPEEKATEFLRMCKKCIVFEELDSTVESELMRLCGKNHIDTDIYGKLSGSTNVAGELSTELVYSYISGKSIQKADIPLTLPQRPPVLCAGCPHRASFYGIKKAAHRLVQSKKISKAVFCGDIGCYTLGNGQPLDMVDTCLCMGADVTIAQGIHAAEKGSLCFSFIGDSTFFASGITGIINAVYNGNDIFLIVLDNSTTAMTGHQPHPGTGIKVTGEKGTRIDIESILKGIGLAYIKTVDPFDTAEVARCVEEAYTIEGVRALILRSPCVAKFKVNKRYTVKKDICTGCNRCIKEIGCPAVHMDGNTAEIDVSVCTGCGLCKSICKFKAIEVDVDGI